MLFISSGTMHSGTQVVFHDYSTADQWFRTKIQNLLGWAIAAIKSKHTDMTCRRDLWQVVRLQRVLRGIRFKGKPNFTRPRLPVVAVFLVKFRSNMTSSISGTASAFLLIVGTYDSVAPTCCSTAVATIKWVLPNTTP